MTLCAQQTLAASTCDYLNTDATLTVKDGNNTLVYNDDGCLPVGASPDADVVPYSGAYLEWQNTLQYTKTVTLVAGCYPGNFTECNFVVTYTIRGPNCAPSPPVSPPPIALWDTQTGNGRFDSDYMTFDIPYPQ